MPLEELRRGVGQQRAGDRPERHAAGDAEVGRDVAGGLLAEGPLVGGGEAPPAVLGRERDPGVAGVEQLALQRAALGDLLGRPRLGAGDDRTVDRAPVHVGLEPDPRRDAVLLEVGGCLPCGLLPSTSTGRARHRVEPAHDLAVELQLEAGQVLLGAGRRSAAR